jgi:hypothetical protein
MPQTQTTSEAKSNIEVYPAYLPTPTEQVAINQTLKDIIQGRLVINRSYNYFNNNSLYDVIDDWTMRWNGYTEPLGVLDETSSNIFLNFTRNLIISYLSKVAMGNVDPKIIAVNKKTNILNKKFADLLKDLNQYSLNEENGPARFLEAALECTIKGTSIVYEGYVKNNQKIKTPISFDAETGKFEFKEEDRTIFENCYQEIVALEDFYIANPYQPDIQKQPFVLWKRITTYDEAFAEYNHYKNWKFVKPGAYSILAEPTTFYRDRLQTELTQSQVEIIKYYNRRKNIHRVIVNGVILYDGPIPFKHGKYPFAKYIFEPFANDFFWGAGAPFKFMGEQDLQNNLINMLTDKTYGSLQPYGLSSDLDDLIEDDTLAPNKIRKVGDVNKWKFDTLPGVSAGEQQMFQTVMGLIKDNSGLSSGADQFSPTGGKVSVRQVLLKQQEMLQKIGFPINFLEDGELNRTELRVKNIMQFYSVPKIEKITGKDGKEIKELVYRQATLHETTLSDGTIGTKVIKMVGEDAATDENKRQQLADELSITEEMGDLQGTPTEALAIPVSMFENFDTKIQIVKNSSYTRNQTLDQAARQEYANWRLSLAPVAPLNAPKLIKWVDEAYDIDPEEFGAEPNENVPQQNQLQPSNQPQPTPPSPQAQPAKQMSGLQLNMSNILPT